MGVSSEGEDRLKLASDINIVLDGCILVLQGWSSIYSKGHYVSSRNRDELVKIRDELKKLLDSIIEIDKVLNPKKEPNKISGGEDLPDCHNLYG